MTIENNFQKITQQAEDIIAIRTNPVSLIDSLEEVIAASPNSENIFLDGGRCLDGVALFDFCKNVNNTMEGLKGQIMSKLSLITASNGQGQKNPNNALVEKEINKIIESAQTRLLNNAKRVLEQKLQIENERKILAQMRRMEDSAFTQDVSETKAASMREVADSFLVNPNDKSTFSTVG
jgi:hypothetical protein